MRHDLPDVSANSLTLTLDAQHRPCAVHVDASGVSLHRLEAGRWETRQLRNQPSVGVRVARGPSGELWAAWDAGGRLHNGIAYAAEGLRLEAARIDGPEIAVETIAEGLWDYGYGPKHWSLAVGADGPVVAWNHKEQIKVAQRKAGKWSVEAGPSGERDWVQLALDPSGAPHLLLSKDFVLHHARRAGTDWKLTPVGARYETAFCDLAIDANGTPHVAWHGRAKTKDQLLFATLQGDAVTPEVVDKKGNAGFGVRLCLAADGTPHLAYWVEASREGAGSRKVVPGEHRRAVRRDGKWTVESLGEGGWANGLALHDATTWVAFPTTLKGGLSLVSLP
jgi:hypothetical protein